MQSLQLSYKILILPLFLAEALHIKLPYMLPNIYNDYSNDERMEP